MIDLDSLFPAPVPAQDEPASITVNPAGTGGTERNRPPVPGSEGQEPSNGGPYGSMEPVEPVEPVKMRRGVNGAQQQPEPARSCVTCAHRPPHWLAIQDAPCGDPVAAGLSAMPGVIRYHPDQGATCPAWQPRGGRNLWPICRGAAAIVADR
jgi:hypothetical protein